MMSCASGGDGQVCEDEERCYEGFDVACNGTEWELIMAADSHAATLLDATIAATENAMFDFISSNEAPERPPYLPVTNRFLAIFGNSSDVFANVLGKLRNVSAVRANSLHTCHALNEPVATVDGVLRTCDSLAVAAAATSVFGANPPVRWCPFGLGLPVQERAVTLLHELIHQDRTANPTGDRTTDDNSLGIHNNAHNYSRWLNEAPGF
jgi:hypothetical protein